MRILTLAAASAAMLSVTACHAADPPRTNDAPPLEVAVVSVEQVDWPSTFEAGGVVRAALTATVSSRIIAPVVAVHVSAGDRIRRGQPLVTLDARELRANADRAAAARAAAREAATAAAAQQDAAGAALTLARASHDRVRTLHDTRSATPQELDDAVAAVESAAAGLSASRAQAAAAAASLDAARAATEAVQVGLSYAVLTAPFDGVVAGRSVDPGTLAMPGVELLGVESAGGYRLEVQVDQSRRSGLEAGQEAEIRLDTSSHTPAWTKSRIAEIARIDPRQHSFLVKLDVPESSAVRSGLFGRARFFGPRRSALAAPASAVVRRGQLWFAFVLDADSVARLRVLTPGAVHGGLVEIQSGLHAGDRLVAGPPPSLADGARVRVATMATSEPSSTGAWR